MKDKLMVLSEKRIMAYAQGKLNWKRITDFHVDSKDRLWVVRDHIEDNEPEAPSVMVFDKYGGTKTFTFGKDGLPSGRLVKVGEDGEGRIWVGSRANGLSVYDEKSGQWKTTLDVPSGAAPLRSFSWTNLIDNPMWYDGHCPMLFGFENGGYVLHVITSYGLQPRGVIVAPPNGEPKRYLTGALCAGVVTDQKDGRRLFFGTSNPCNGSAATQSGTYDSYAYAVCINMEGGEIWKRRLGDYASGACSAGPVADLDGDGIQNEVAFFLHPNSTFSQNPFNAVVVCLNAHTGETLARWRRGRFDLVDTVLGDFNTNPQDGLEIAVDTASGVIYVLKLQKTDGRYTLIEIANSENVRGRESGQKSAVRECSWKGLWGSEMGLILLYSMWTPAKSELKPARKEAFLEAYRLRGKALTKVWEWRVPPEAGNLYLSFKANGEDYLVFYRKREEKSNKKSILTFYRVAQDGVPEQVKKEEKPYPSDVELERVVWRGAPVLIGKKRISNAEPAQYDRRKVFIHELWPAAECERIYWPARDLPTFEADLGLCWLDIDSERASLVLSNYSDDGILRPMTERTVLTIPRAGPLAGRVSDLCAARKPPREMYVGYDGGLCYFDGNTWYKFGQVSRRMLLSEKTHVSATLPSPSVTALEMGQDDALWVGTTDGLGRVESYSQAWPGLRAGMLRRRRRDDEFVFISRNQHPMQPSLVALLDTESLARKVLFQERNVKAFMPQGVSCMAASDRGVFSGGYLAGSWIGLRFFPFNSDRSQVRKYGADDHRALNQKGQITDMKLDADGALWVSILNDAYGGGLLLKGSPDRGRMSFKRHPISDALQRQDASVYAIAIGRDGYLYLGADKGVFRFDPKARRPLLEQLEGGVPGVLSSEVVGDEVWLGGASGVQAYNTKSGDWVNHAEALKRLHIRRAFSISKAARESRPGAWILSDSGAARYFSDLDLWVSFDEIDAQDLVETRDGTLIYSTQRQLRIMRPVRNEAPRVYITALPRSVVKGLTATVKWEGAHLREAEHLLYRWRYAPSDAILTTEWSKWSSAKSIQLRRLDPGSYKFQLQAIDRWGNASERVEGEFKVLESFKFAESMPDDLEIFPSYQTKFPPSLRMPVIENTTKRPITLRISAKWSDAKATVVTSDEIEILPGRDNGKRVRIDHLLPPSLKDARNVNRAINTAEFSFAVKEIPGDEVTKRCDVLVRDAETARFVDLARGFWGDFCRGEESRVKAQFFAERRADVEGKFPREIAADIWKKMLSYDIRYEGLYEREKETGRAKLSSPLKVLKSRKADCVEISMLFATLLRCCGIQSVLIFIEEEKHAICAFDTGNALLSMPFDRDTIEELTFVPYWATGDNQRRLQTPGNAWLAVDPTMAIVGPKTETFESAVRKTWDDYNKYFSPGRSVFSLPFYESESAEKAADRAKRKGSFGVKERGRDHVKRFFEAEAGTLRTGIRGELGVEVTNMRKRRVVLKDLETVSYTWEIEAKSNDGKHKKLTVDFDTKRVGEYQNQRRCVETFRKAWEKTP